MILKKLIITGLENQKTHYPRGSCDHRFSRLCLVRLIRNPFFLLLCWSWVQVVILKPIVVKKPRRVLSLILIFFCIIIFSCKITEVETHEKGELNKNGILIIHVFKQLKSGKEIPVILKDDYGIMIFNEGDESNPIARYELSKQKENTILEFENFDNLLKSISNLPKGSKIAIYDKCTIPTYYGLKSFSEEKLVNFCIELELVIADHRKITCTCPE